MQNPNVIMRSRHTDAAHFLAQFTPESILGRLDLERLDVARRLKRDQHRRAELGQFMTPAGVAAFMASLLGVSSVSRNLQILDAGSGTGMLTAAVVAELSERPSNQRPAGINVVAWEIDRTLKPHWERTFEFCQRVALHSGIEFTADVRFGNFICEAADLVGSNSVPGSGGSRLFDVAILNPPYRKLNGRSPERACLDELGMGTSNLYTAFVWLAMELLRDGGELVAITPRSFMNGTYFRAFREALLQRIAFRTIHVYNARDEAFSTDGVLQENVVFHGVRGGERTKVRVTTSYGPSDRGQTERIVDLSEIVLPDDAQSVFRLASDENDARIARSMLGLRHRLLNLGISVSTGRVVRFRATQRLHNEVEPSDVPIIFPRHCRDGFVEWPSTNPGVPNGLSVSGPRDKLVLPSGWYVLVNRFSAKEDRRRVVASLFDPKRLNADYVGFENKLNVIHCRNGGLPEHLAKGLAVFLNSSVVDSFFRQFSGHTQVNAADLRSLKYPDGEALVRLGNHVEDLMPCIDEIDLLLSNEVPAMTDGVDASATTKRVDEALEILRSIGVPRSQENERSALTLLALLDLSPTDPWSASTSSLRSVTEIMSWMNSNYGKSYVPNTRETIRCFTLHQFIALGLVDHTPEDPARTVNSPNNEYQVHQTLLDLVRTFGSEDWNTTLRVFQEDRNRLTKA